MPQPLKAIALVCSLKSSTDPSSSEVLAQQMLDGLKQYDVESTLIRVVDHNVMPGVELDMGPGDAWPGIRKQIMAADILLLATPIWVGHPSSICQRVIERLDAELSETDEQGRLLTYGKVGIVGVVGNEDGAHKVSADLFQALSDVGFTIPAIGSAYWVGEAMQKKDFKDLDETPNAVAETIKSVTANAAHLARLLRESPYPETSENTESHGK
ncbi:MAG TPA: NAD(P)H-dependent oxidoreductase [Candidatus Saccharimonadales bacterium]|nr:NAD(P)H-dependent oxidoreductase [Candidatus Saccharimonadales bacterium]